jgi:hypothetical protein
VIDAFALSIKYTDRLAAAEIDASVDTVGNSYDAFAETLFYASIEETNIAP